MMSKAPTFLILLGIVGFCGMSGNLFGQMINEYRGLGGMIETIAQTKIQQQHNRHDPRVLGLNNNNSSNHSAAASVGVVVSSDSSSGSPGTDQPLEEEQQQEAALSDSSTAPPTSTTTTTLPTFPPKQAGDDDNPTIYLEYMAKWGWSNQAYYCAQKAYYIAKATGAVFVTAPVLSHFFGMGYNLWEAHATGVYPPHDLHWAYMERLPPEEYVRLDQVLDAEYTFPNVTLMDYRDFSLAKQHAQQTYHQNFTTWTLESQYSPTNTHYTKGRPDVEGHPIREGITQPQYHDLQLIRSQRDQKALAENDTNDQVWTLLNSFFAVLHPSVMDHGRFDIRYSRAIRQTGQKIQQQIWNNIPYLSLHLRFTDGDFRQDLRKLDTTVKAIHNSRKLIVAAIQKFQQQQQPQQPPLPEQIGIFVATDLPNGPKQIVSGFVELHVTDFWENNKIKVVVWDSSTFQDYTDQLKPTLVYPGIFLDQHLAACGSLGFVGAEGSTFSQMIDAVRSSPGACDA